MYKKIPDEYKDDDFYNKIMQINPKNFIYLPKNQLKSSDYINYFFKHSNYENFFNNLKDELTENKDIYQIKI